MRLSTLAQSTAFSTILALGACSEKPDDSEKTASTDSKDSKDSKANTSKVTTPVNADVLAEAVYFNGTIITVNDDQPKAQAVAVKDGKIIYVGDLRGAKAMIGEKTRRIDLNNFTMVPGFVDAHGHVVNAGLQAAGANLLPLPDGPVNSKHGCIGYAGYQWCTKLEKCVRSWELAKENNLPNTAEVFA